MIAELVIGGIATLLLLKKKAGTAGIGKVKFYKALAEAQQRGVRFGMDAASLNKKELAVLQNVGVENGYRQSKKSAEAGKPYPLAFYTYLNNKYKAVAGIGKIEYPYKEYVVKNGNGDAIVVFHDYDRKEDLREAMNLADNAGMTAEEYGYYNTLSYLASGGKFIWKSKYVGGSTAKSDRIGLGVEDELFGNRGQKHPEEMKRRRWMLATEKNGGVYPEQFAEQLAHYVPTGEGDSGAVKNGVLQAIRSIGSRKEAEDELLQLYYSQFEVQDSPEEYTPF